uniref:PDZ domain-containing protein n=1 Tax=Panagrellus redivivus TaxID=6233 RepID=A0A7E4VJX6_PANRE
MRVFLLAVLPSVISAADTCFTAGELAGVIFISIFGAFVICVGAGLIIWFLIRKFEKAEKQRIFEKAHATQVTDSSASSADLEERGMVTDDGLSPRKRVSVRDKETEAALPTPLPRRKLNAAAETSPKNGRSRSLDNLQSEDEKRRLAQLLALRRFGFSIDGNEDDGIFIDRVLPGTPAEESGNIFAGDKIKTLTVSFENMTFDDALAVLALVTDYTIRLDLERVTQLDEMTQTEGGIVTGLMKLGPLKSASSGNVKRRLQNCPHRQCESAETLGAPALPPQQPGEPKNIPLPSCKCNMEEERVIKIVRHAKKPRLESINESETSEGSSIPRGVGVPPGHTLIRASDFDRRMKTLIETEAAATRVHPALMDASSDSGESSAGSTSEEFSESVEVVVNKNRTVVTSSETTVDVNSNTRVLREAAATLQPTVHSSPKPVAVAPVVPVPKLEVKALSPIQSASPEPELESIAVQADEITESSVVESDPTSIAESIPEAESESSAPSIVSSLSPVVSESSPGPSVTPMESLSVEVGPSVNLAVTSPHSGGLTPDFVEVRAQKFTKPEPESGIVDRKLPSLPDSATKQPNKLKPTDAGQMYLNVRSRLKEVYTSPGAEVDSAAQKPVLSETQYNTLESNRRKLELEQQQLKELGIL